MADRRRRDYDLRLDLDSEPLPDDEPAFHDDEIPLLDDVVFPERIDFDPLTAFDDLQDEEPDEEPDEAPADQPDGEPFTALSGAIEPAWDEEPADDDRIPRTAVSIHAPDTRPEPDGDGEPPPAVALADRLPEDEPFAEDPDGDRLPEEQFAVDDPAWAEPPHRAELAVAAQDEPPFDEAPPAAVPLSPLATRPVEAVTTADDDLDAVNDADDSDDELETPPLADALAALIREMVAEAVDEALDEALDRLRPELQARLRTTLDERLSRLLAAALRRDR